MKIELVANLAFTVVQEECLDQKLQQKPILLLQVFTVKIASSIKCLFSACEPATKFNKNTTYSSLQGPIKLNGWERNRCLMKIGPHS